ncbi:MAG: hypothetical protein FGF48_09165, partial [Candidatus Brockarchaeota archaeon]|nr:hypothetical protein [Candidatus Brockarchaeota archaeon]
SINASATTIGLTYDDGGAEGFWSDYYPNSIAVRFTPPISRWRITAILIYGFAIIKSEKPFIIEVRESDFNVIFRASILVSNYFKNATLDWTRIPLPSVVVKGDFYVCVYPMLEPNGTQLWIAIDNDTVSGRSLLVDCYRQETKRYDRGNAMMRVEGEEATDFAEIIPDSIFVEEEVLRIFFRVITRSNVTEISAVLQRGPQTVDCKVVRKGELYEVVVDWPRLSGLKELAKLKLRAKTLNSTTTLVVKLGEILFSKYLRLRDESESLRAMLNNSKLKQEASEHVLGGEETDVTVLRASLEAYEKKWLKEAKEVEKLTRELNAMRLLTGFLGLSTVLLFIALLKRGPIQARPLRNEGSG